jgi:hypothetical protein
MFQGLLCLRGSRWIVVVGGVFFAILIKLFFLFISKSFMHDTLARQSQRCLRDCSGVLAVVFLEKAQVLLSRFVCVLTRDPVVTSCHASDGAAIIVLKNAREFPAGGIFHDMFVH